MSKNAESTACLDRVEVLLKGTDSVLDRVEAGLARFAEAKAKLDSEWTKDSEGNWVEISPKEA